MIKWLIEKFTHKCRRCGRQMIKNTLQPAAKPAWICPVQIKWPFPQNCENVKDRK